MRKALYGSTSRTCLQQVRRTPFAKPMDMENQSIRYHLFPVFYALDYEVRQINDFCHNDIMIRPRNGGALYRAVQVKTCWQRSTKHKSACFYNINKYGNGFFPNGVPKHESLLALVCLQTAEIWLVPGSLLTSHTSGILKIGQRSRKYDKFKVSHTMNSDDRRYLQRRLFTSIGVQVNVLSKVTKRLDKPKHRAFRQQLKHKVDRLALNHLLDSTAHWNYPDFWNWEGLSYTHYLESYARHQFNDHQTLWSLAPVVGGLSYDSYLCPVGVSSEASTNLLRVQEKVCYQDGSGFTCRFYKKNKKQTSPYAEGDFDVLLGYLMGGWDSQQQWIPNARTHLLGYWLIPLSVLLDQHTLSPRKYFTLHASLPFYDATGVRKPLSETWSQPFFYSVVDP